ncbi:MAG: hypothetical protein Q8R02_11225 [Hyphomonadaceae bacterium]|nr:hypothetical protein [Hyphomonadaceae bacterium]
MLSNSNSGEGYHGKSNSCVGSLSRYLECNSETVDIDVTRAKVQAFVVSLDHSPSEQLGNDESWHTSVAIFSVGNEHWECSKQLAAKLGMTSGRLRKWSGRGGESYRKRFAEHLFESIAANPIHVRAISAQAKTIRRLLPKILEDLGLALVVSEVREPKKQLRFGPFQVVSQDGLEQERYLSIHPNRGGYVVYLCWWLIEMHRQCLLLEKRYDPNIEWIDWFLMPNKFAGGIEGDMAELFHALTSCLTAAGQIVGNIRTSTLHDSSVDAGSGLADNIAGFLNQKIRSGEDDLPPPNFTGQGASFLWSTLALDSKRP